ncbi:MAG TPA: methyltransferase domain-containing protein [Nakamurella sp.]
MTLTTDRPLSDGPAAPADAVTAPADAVTELADRLFEAGVAAFEMFSIYLGDRMGWYRSLAADGPATPAELAARTGTAERYAREWLEQQAVAGFVRAEPRGATHRFWLPPAAAEVLTDTGSLSYLAPLARFIGGVGVQLHELSGAYRTGGGVSWAQFGADALTAQAEMNRPWFDRELPRVLSEQPELHALLSRPGARIADIGCGVGWSSLALARAYPQARVIGFDIDDPSVDSARVNAAGTAEGERVRFVASDAAELVAHGPFDVVFAFECVHDMARPVEALAAARAALAPGGVMVIMDEATADAFAPDGDLVERLFYGWSITLCLPDSLSHHGSVGTGTVMRADTLREYATAAGFTEFGVLPTGEFGLWRFYRLG